MIYFGIISLVAVVITAYDKVAAKHIRHARIPEMILLLLSAAGGSIAMLFTMLAISHKTRKYKFMVGIPLIIILQALAIVAIKKLGLL